MPVTTKDGIKINSRSHLTTIIKYKHELLAMMDDGPTRKICDKKSCEVEVKGFFRGKKRPEHSVKMSEVMNYLSENGLLDRSKASERINSKSYKISGLYNAGIIDDKDSDYEDDFINSKYKELQSMRQRTPKYKKNCIINYTNRHSDELLVRNHLVPIIDNISYDNIEHYYKLYNSIKSTISMTHNPNMGGVFIDTHLLNILKKR
jgi:hypothetical protein